MLCSFSFSVRALAVSLCLAAGAAFAGSGTEGDISSLKDGATCPDTGFSDGASYNNLCWSCFFPIRIAGENMSSEDSGGGGGAGGAGPGGIGPGSGGIPSGYQSGWWSSLGDSPTYIGSRPSVPDDPADGICQCEGHTGYESIGITKGMWYPSHLIEVVRQPYCSPVMGKVLNSTGEGEGGGKTGGPTHSTSKLQTWGGYDTGNERGGKSHETAFYNYHSWEYPVNDMIRSMVDGSCSDYGGADPGLAWMSEIDPSWRNDELAVYTQPEIKLFAKPLVVASCAIDAVAASIYKPILYMEWCIGSWGDLYPFTGRSINGGDPPTTTSAIAAKGLAQEHRLGLALRTYGDQAVCNPIPSPQFQKQQYRFQTFYPIAETKGNHWVGDNAFLWGEWRNVPAIGEDYVYVQWTYKECCNTLW